MKEVRDEEKSIDHTQLLLLKLLAGEDMYGYQIIFELARRSSNVRNEGGTLYPVLHGMEREGLWRPMKRLRLQAACANTITSRAPARSAHGRGSILAGVFRGGERRAALCVKG